MADVQPLIPYDKIANYLIPLGLLSGFIAWSRNSDTNIVFRVIFVILAYLFNVFYLLYILYRWVFG
jgi:hypothetical protein